MPHPFLRRHSCVLIAPVLLAGGWTSVCVADDGPIVPFTEEAITRGIIYLSEPGSFGRGILLADLDSDGDPDFVATGSASMGIYRNDGTGQFVDVTDVSDLPPIINASGVTAADFDGDGDLDLHVSCNGHPDRLLRNDGDLRFVDATEAAGLDVPVANGRGQGAAWADFDLDGDLDLAITAYTEAGGPGPNGQPNALFRNDDGVFTDVAPALGLDDDQSSLQAVWLDIEDDGDPDLYFATDRGGPATGFTNRLFRNDGDGTFTEVSKESGAGVAIDSMGVAIGDLDGNGSLDLYLTNVRDGGNRLLMNDGTGVFTEQGPSAGVESFWLSWGTQFLDFDNDRDLDLYVCNSVGQPNRLYRNVGEFPMVDFGPQSAAIAFGPSYALAIGDVDLDGDLDLIVQNQGELIKLYINNEGSRRNHTRVRVEGIGWNRHAIGARLTGTIGEALLVREIAAGSNYKSMNELVQHFGLGDATQLDTLDVRWPDGVVRSFTGVPHGETWTLAHPDLLGDSNDDGEFDVADLPAVQSRWNTTVSPGDERFDFNGDFAIDANDDDALLAAWDGPVEDCDDDGTIDVLQIVADPSLDLDGDGLLDACAGNPADLNGDGAVNGADLAIVLANWGGKGGEGDVDGSGVVDGADVAQVLGAWTG